MVNVKPSLGQSAESKKLDLIGAGFTKCVRGDSRTRRSQLRRVYQDNCADDDKHANHHVSIDEFAAKHPSEKHRDDGVHVRVRCDFWSWNVLEQPDVRGESDE